MYNEKKNFHFTVILVFYYNFFTDEKYIFLQMFP